MNGVQIKRVSFIAPSTCLPRCEKSRVNQTISRLKKILGEVEVELSPHLFSSDELIDHVTAPLEDRAENFKQAIRNSDLIISVAGGTGAEDILFKIDKKDYQVMRERKPIFIGFSDFTFLLSDIYYNSRIPVIYFPTLRLGQGNFKKIAALLFGQPVQYHGSAWLTEPLKRKLTGIPLGGNLSTFVNYLNRKEPPAFNWKKHILFFEDVQIDVEDLHRLLAALRRHKVFNEVKGIVIGSMAYYSKNHNYRNIQKESLRFIRNYLQDIIRKRKARGNPLPILSVSNFGHNIPRDLMAVPIGGHVIIDPNKNITFRLHRPRKNKRH
ncbi:MAG: LD-carboxypeptidase [Candidatus Aminicenantes bacterium]|nr:LD-carboxypeptidase [Candidatus Aminicenantes bacterium]